MNVEIRFVMQGKEVSVDSVVEAIVREVRAAVREEVARTLSRQESRSSEPSLSTINELSRQAVSIREAARLLSLSPRTIHNYIASNSIRTVRVGRRVLVPMKSVTEIASRGIRSRRSEKVSLRANGVLT
jgi:excisionase family DNA binding protein